MSMVLPLMVISMLLIVGATVVAGGFIGSTTDASDELKAALERRSEIARTELEVEGIDFSSPTYDVALRNAGQISLRSFSTWDLWAAFHEADGTYHAARLTYTTASTPAAGEWTVVGVYTDAASLTADVYQPGLLDPSEELLVRFRPAATLADPEVNLVTLGAPNSITATTAFTFAAETVASDTVDSGAALTNDGTSVYAFRGNASSEFWRYDAGASAWTGLAPASVAVDTGAALAYAKDGGAGFIYGLCGGTSTDFWRYSISGGTWAARQDTLTNAGSGGALAWNGSGTIYGLRGGINSDFWAYDITADAWSSLTNTPASVSSGGSLVYLSDALYVLRGSDSADFWRYDVPTAAWTTLASAPANVQKGAALATDGTDLYALRGNVTTGFWKYCVVRDAWTDFADTPAAVGWGGALTRLSGTLYAFRGDGNTDFWSFALPVYLP